MYVRNARNNVVATPLGPSITEGTYSLELGCCWYVLTTEVTGISSVRIVEHKKTYQQLK